MLGHQFYNPIGLIRFIRPCVVCRCSSWLMEAVAYIMIKEETQFKPQLQFVNKVYWGSSSCCSSLCETRKPWIQWDLLLMENGWWGQSTWAFKSPKLFWISLKDCHVCLGVGRWMEKMVHIQCMWVFGRSIAGHSDRSASSSAWTQPYFPHQSCKSLGLHVRWIQVSNLYHIAFGKGLVNLCVCIICQIIYKSFTAIVGIQSPIGDG